MFAYRSTGRQSTKEMYVIRQTSLAHHLLKDACQFSAANEGEVNFATGMDERLNCTNQFECEAACPKEISVEIAMDLKIYLVIRELVANKLRV